MIDDGLLIEIARVAVLVSAVCAAALGVARLLRHSPATRHAVLLCAVIVCATGPAWIRGASSLSLQRPYGLKFAGTYSSNVGQSKAAQPPRRTSGVELHVWRAAASALIWIWACGAIIAMGRLLYAFVRIEQRWARATWRDDAVLARARPFIGEAALPAVFLSDDAPGPMSIGLLRPRVILPAELANELSDRELAQVLAHEWAHALRRDQWVGLLSRLVCAAWWAHPLVRLVCRELARAREEVCDNFAASLCGPTEYARTLLKVAQRIDPRPVGVAAFALFPSRWKLELRVADLLHERRNLMTRTNRWTFTAVAVGLGLVAMAIASIGPVAGAQQAPPASQPAANDPVNKKVDFELGAQNFLDGDSITISDVRGTSDTIEVGRTYIVRGHYKLASHDQATLALFITASTRQGGGTPISPDQTMSISKGEGDFVLLEQFSCPGYFHVSFYPAGHGGDSFGGVYFGKGQTLLKTKSPNAVDRVSH